MPSCVAVAFPANFKYTSDHEWIEAAETAKVGISDFAQEELGDLVYVDLPEASLITTIIGSRHAPHLVAAISECRMRRWARSLKKARLSLLLKA